MKRKNQSGFIIADFLFSFVMVIGIGIFIFGITFSLATIEVAQYILWSTARNYSAANVNEEEARTLAEQKFEALADQFPLLTNSDGRSGWFELSRQDLIIGNLAIDDTKFQSEVSSGDLANDFRQPWTGASTTLNLKLFSGLQIPFLGKVAEDRSLFEFPIRAFIIRNVSEDECREYFKPENRYELGVKKLEQEELAPESFNLVPNNANILHGEDNGC